MVRPSRGDGERDEPKEDPGFGKSVASAAPPGRRPGSGRGAPRMWLIHGYLLLEHIPSGGIQPGQHICGRKGRRSRFKSGKGGARSRSAEFQGMQTLGGWFLHSSRESSAFPALGTDVGSCRGAGSEFHAERVGIPKDFRAGIIPISSHQPCAICAV